MMKTLDYIKKLILNNKNKLWFKISLFVLLFIIYLLLYYNNSTITLDEIWNYGFAYNISHGLIPYLDFNIIQTPLYPYLLAILIKLFGNHFVVMIVFNSFLSAVLHCLLIKKYGYKTMLLFPCIFFSNCTCYNFLSLILFMVLLNIDEKENSDYLKGLIIALMVFTKQTTGGVLLIATFCLSKNKKKFLIGFLPLCFIYLGYLLSTNSLYNFFDYCLFSLLDFTGGNSFSSTNWSVIFYILIVLVLIRLNIVKKFKDRDLIYILCFQIMAAPLFDFMHIIVTVIPFMAYLLSKKIEKNIFGYFALIGIVFHIAFPIMFAVFHTMFSPSDIYTIEDSFLSGKSVNFNLNNVHKILDDINKDYPGRLVYHLYSYAYLVKLEHNQTLVKYDLNLIGNMGYHGEERCIEEVKDKCSRQACLIIIDRNVKVGSQLSLKISSFIRENYQFEREMYDLDFYIN